MVIDALKSHFNAPAFKPELQSLISKVHNPDLLLSKPQTFMNLSGAAVQEAMNYYRIDVADLLVVHDEVDLPFGQLKMQMNRGHGGNNGVRSIHEILGHPNYARLRLGVGRSTNPNMSTADHVLQSFSNEEQDGLGDFIAEAAEAVIYFAEQGFNKAANIVNTQEK
jgi:PTH1 family peptidyl-tRNA hydrolase